MVKGGNLNGAAEQESEMGVIGLELEDAVEVILNWTKEIKEVEMVAVKEAGNRILAQDLFAGFDQPPFAKSPLDGYAFAAQSVKDAKETVPVSLSVIQTIYAGDFFAHPVQAGEAVKIMTGAPIPAGCDCVIRQEEVTVKNSWVQINRPLERYENYCFPGEDFKKGTHLLGKGDKITFIEMGILACAGLKQVAVYRKPRVALFVTGDELIPPGQVLEPGKIYDSNLFLLQGRLQELSIEVLCAQHLQDDPASAAQAIRAVARQVDAVITTGGVSVGEKDIFHEIIPLLGCERLFWKLKMKPGTPAMFSCLDGQTPMLNLSGNPFAALTTFELLARPLLAKLGRDQSLPMRQIQAVLADDFAKESRSRRFIRAFYDGHRVHLPQIYGHASGVLSSMKGCNCLLEINAQTKHLERGDQVVIRLL